jgi:putative tricarboxylic transport membrane protein
MREYKSDAVVASFLIVLGIMIYICILRFPPKTQLYPKIIAFLLIGFSFLLLIRSFSSLLTRKEKNDKRLTLGTPVVFYFFSVNIVYIFSIYFIGLHLANVLYLSGSLYLLGQKNIVIGFLYSLSIVAFLYLVFVGFLHVPVPKGIFFH